MSSPHGIEMDLEVAGSPGVFVSGWGDKEAVAKPRRWGTGRSSIVTLELQPAAAWYVLELGVQSLAGPDPQRMDVTLNGQKLGTLLPSPLPGTLRLAVPATVLVRGENVFKFDYAWSRRPMDVEPGSQDDRDLAVAFERIALKPLSDMATLDAGDDSIRPLAPTRWARKELRPGQVALENRGGPSSFECWLARSSGHYFFRASAVLTAKGEAPFAVVRINGSDVGAVQLSRAMLLEFAAGVLKDGRNEIEIVYPVGSGGDPLAGWDGFELLPSSDHVRIVPGTPGSAHYLTAGFSELEKEGLHGFAWSDAASSELIVPLAPSEGPYLLVLSGKAAVRDLAIQVEINGNAVSTVSAGRLRSRMQMGIPPKMLVRGANRLKLTYSGTVRPSEVNPGIHDDRQLALALDQVALTPLRAR